MTQKTDLWALSLCARRGFDTFHGACVVQAAGRDEAVGRGVRIMKTLFPADRGFTYQDATAAPCGVPIDPDDPSALRRLFDVPP